jgi:hypothetical protein
MRFMRRIIMALMLATFVAFAVAGAAWVLVAPPPAKAAFPGHNGRIVFWREDSNGVAQIWVADKDLSNQVKLTSKSAESGWAAWKAGEAPNWSSLPLAPIPIPQTRARSSTSSR